MNYTFQTSNAGERMDGEKLYNLTVTNDNERLPDYLRKTTIEELTQWELNAHIKQFKEEA